MTDLPGRPARRAGRGVAAAADDPVRTLEADRGTTRKTLWRLFDDALVESVLMRYPDRVTMCVSSQAGLRHGVPVLRDRPGRPPAQHVDRRDRRAGRRRCPVAGPGRGAGRSGPRLQRRVHGHGRAAGQLPGRDRRRTPPHRAGAVRARDERARGHRLDRRAGAADQPAGRAKASRSRSRCPCTRPTTSCATSWSRSTPASRSTRPSTRPGTTRGSPSAGSRSSTP